MASVEPHRKRTWGQRFVYALAALSLGLAIGVLVLALATLMPLRDGVPFAPTMAVIAVAAGVMAFFFYRTMISRRRGAWFAGGAALAAVALLVLGLGILSSGLLLENGGEPGETVGSPGPGPDVPAKQDMPSFPWPPPRASAMQTLPTLFLHDPVSLADVARTLRMTLSLAGRHELRFYAVPDGFAMVTRLESIDAQGNTLAGVDRPTRAFLTYIRDLFWVPPGRYRMVVFVVTDRAFEASGDAIDRSEAEAFMAGGFNDLPDVVGARPYADGYRTTALVYEFHKDPQDERAHVLIPGRFDAYHHLQKIGWYSASAEIPAYAELPVIFPDATASGARRR